MVLSLVARPTPARLVAHHRCWVYGHRRRFASSCGSIYCSSFMRQQYHQFSIRCTNMEGTTSTHAYRDDDDNDTYYHDSNSTNSKNDNNNNNSDSHHQEVLLPMEDPTTIMSTTSTPSPIAKVATLVSLAGISHEQVQIAINQLYKPQDVEERMAMSRTDGYWPYIREGNNPPPELTYGEFDVLFFAQLLDYAREFYTTTHVVVDENDGTGGISSSSSSSSRTASAATYETVIPPIQKKNNWSNKVFVDMGSGTGRLVMAAAALHPNWRLCRGIELLSSVHDVAMEYALNYTSSYGKRNNTDVQYMSIQSSTNSTTTTTTSSSSSAMNSNCNCNNTNTYHSQQGMDTTTHLLLQEDLDLAPVEFICGSFADPYVYFGDADCLFVYATCFPTDTMTVLAQSIGRQCRPGTVIVTVDATLPLSGTIPPNEWDNRIPYGTYQLELKNQIKRYCSSTTGEYSIAYFYIVTSSLWRNGNQPLSPRQPTREETAYEAIIAAETNQRNRFIKFKRGIYNNMVFVGIPERFYPILDNE